jgi:hypothetical protein
LIHCSKRPGLRQAWRAPREMLKCEQAILCVSCEYLSEPQFLSVFMMNMPIDPCHNSSQDLIGVHSEELQVSCMDSERLSRTISH